MELERDAHAKSLMLRGKGTSHDGEAAGNSCTATAARGPTRTRTGAAKDEICSGDSQGQRVEHDRAEAAGAKGEGRAARRAQLSSSRRQLGWRSAAAARGDEHRLSGSCSSRQARSPSPLLPRPAVHLRVVHHGGAVPHGGGRVVVGAQRVLLVALLQRPRGKWGQGAGKRAHSGNRRHEVDVLAW